MIKSYTDLQQSKKLAEILSLESADMYFIGHQSIINPKEWEYGDTPNIRGKYISFDDKRIFYPCWSLAALLGVLPNGIVMNKDSQNGRYHFSSTHVGTYVTVDNPVDACVDMIEKLYKLNLL